MVDACWINGVLRDTYVHSKKKKSDLRAATQKFPFKYYGRKQALSKSANGREFYLSSVIVTCNPYYYVAELSHDVKNLLRVPH